MGNLGVIELSKYDFFAANNRLRQKSKIVEVFDRKFQQKVNKLIVKPI
jgi:hypothetical protein